MGTVQKVRIRGKAIWLDHECDGCPACRSGRGVIISIVIIGANLLPRVCVGKIQHISGQSLCWLVDGILEERLVGKV